MSRRRSWSDEGTVRRSTDVSSALAARPHVLAHRHTAVEEVPRVVVERQEVPDREPADRDRDVPGLVAPLAGGPVGVEETRPDRRVIRGGIEAAGTTDREALPRVRRASTPPRSDPTRPACSRWRRSRRRSSVSVRHRTSAARRCLPLPESSRCGSTPRLRPASRRPRRRGRCRSRCTWSRARGSASPSAVPPHRARSVGHLDHRRRSRRHTGQGC